jgi:hypothetical protein
LRSFPARCSIAFERLPRRWIHLAPRLTGPFARGAISSVLTVLRFGVIIQKTIAYGTISALCVIPAAVLPFLPVATLIAAVNISIATGINVVALFSNKVATVLTAS